MTKSATILILLFSITNVFADKAKEDYSWSKPVSGVKGRLSLEKNKTLPFLNAFIEFQNVSGVANAIKIPFSPDKLTLSVSDLQGNDIPVQKEMEYDGMQPTWESVLLPYKGTLRFQFSFPGLGYNPEKDKTIIDIGPDNCWIIPAKGTFILSGKLTIKRKFGNPDQGWYGELIFPPIVIPKNE